MVAILHIIALEPTCVRFQIRGLEYEQQTLCHNGELSVIQQIILEQKDFGNLGHAIAFHFSMFELIEKSLDLNMISVSQYNYNEIVFAVLGSDSTLQWFFRACAYIAARDQSEFIDQNANNDQPSSNIANDSIENIKDDIITINIDDENESFEQKEANESNSSNDNSNNNNNDNNNNDDDDNEKGVDAVDDDLELGESENSFIDVVFRHFQKQLDSNTLSMIKKAYKFILTKIKGESGINGNGLLTLFNGTFDNKEIKECDEKTRNFIISSVRFGVLLSLNSSVDLAPSVEDDVDDFFAFMNESEEQPVLSVSDDNFLNTIANVESALITLVSISNDVCIVRFSKSVTPWAVFKLETESVRGFWANEARNILFDAIISNERPSIQFDLHFLRNITNQSCNQPVGYPVLVSNVNVSLE